MTTSVIVPATGVFVTLVGTALKPFTDVNLTVQAWPAGSTRMSPAAYLVVSLLSVHCAVGAPFGTTRSAPG